MAKRKTTRRRRATKTTTRRRTTARRRKKSDRLINFFVPLVLMVAIVAGIGAVLFFGFRSVAASSFFEVENIETVGARNVSKRKIESIVRSTAGRGIWETDLEAIRDRISEIKYVKDVSVSRVLPATIKIMIAEREPIGLVRIGRSTYQVDRDAEILEAVKISGKKRMPFVMLGWDTDLSDRAVDENKKRVELYLKLIEDWQEFELNKRVVAVDLSNMRAVDAYINDSGERIVLSLGSEEFGVRLKEGIKHAAGKGKRVSKIILDAPSPVVVYRD